MNNKKTRQKRKFELSSFDILGKNLIFGTAEGIFNALKANGIKSIEDLNAFLAENEGFNKYQVTEILDSNKKDGIIVMKNVLDSSYYAELSVLENKDDSFKGYFIELK